MTRTESKWWCWKVSCKGQWEISWFTS